MNQWRTIALLSLGACCIMLSLLIMAFLSTDQKLKQKNQVITQLKKELATLHEPVADSITKNVEPIKEEVITAAPPALTEETTMQPMSKQTPVIAEPSYKEVLAQYAPHLTQIYFVETYAFDGAPHEMLYEMYPNAGVRHIYEEAYGRIQNIFNEMNDVLQSTLPPQPLAQFNEEQQAWQQTIDATVNELRSHGGSAVGVNVASHLYSETMLRCKDILHNYFDVVEITGRLDS